MRYVNLRVGGPVVVSAGVAIDRRVNQNTSETQNLYSNMPRLRRKSCLIRGKKLVRSKGATTAQVPAGLCSTTSNGTDQQTTTSLPEFRSAFTPEPYGLLRTTLSSPLLCYSSSLPVALHPKLSSPSVCVPADTHCRSLIKWLQSARARAFCACFETVGLFNQEISTSDHHHCLAS